MSACMHARHWRTGWVGVSLYIRRLHVLMMNYVPCAALLWSVFACSLGPPAGGACSAYLPVQ